ncbi:protein kinase [Sphingomonas sp. 1P06PA]|uniref:protein kinase domain-containing protein n=1 Tax=Sphingomonas sp. 1P06PA TaxID=554121 RepID=UPI0039A58E39
MRLVGRYELRDKIGEGAMAEVYRAYDPSIDRVLAIKLLKADVAADAESADRFLREAKAAGALAHPAIVTIYDVGQADGFAYIAMELLDGDTLDTVIAQKGRQSAETVLAIGAQLASALSYAHLSGVVHRDIKPSNIMLAKDGRSIKLLDFGIARVEAREGDHLKTQIGQVIGTPRYMSPEQALGRPLDGRSDLFSVGAVLYELVTGKPAFDGTGAATLALQITQGNPEPITASADDCPGGLRFIIEKLLSKRPERRFADGNDLARAIERETKAFEAVRADAAARGRYVPITVRVTLAMVAVTAVALFLCIGAVLDRQYAAMERMALASGSSIASFVASNAALPSVENAALPGIERDWLPVQAFIAAAARDTSVRWMTMVDNDGIIRGSSDPAKLGTRYHAPQGEAVVHRAGQVTVTDIKLDDGRAGFRFVHPILYADRTFGTIEVSISKAELQTAAATSRALLIALGGIVLLVVAGVSFTVARLLARPVRRLNRALADAALGDLDFRISHQRRDEFGALFDRFNLFATAMQERLEAADRPSGSPRALAATRIAAAPVARIPTPAPTARSA